MKDKLKELWWPVSAIAVMGMMYYNYKLVVVLLHAAQHASRGFAQYALAALFLVVVFAGFGFYWMVSYVYMNSGRRHLTAAIVLVAVGYALGVNDGTELIGFLVIVGGLMLVVWELTLVFPGVVDFALLREPEDFVGEPADEDPDFGQRFLLPQ